MRFALLVALMIAGIFWASAGYGQRPAQQVRVFVEYKPGQKALVKAALEAAGGQIHHEFDNLSVIAVTLPQYALSAIERNPNIVHVELDRPRYPLGKTPPADDPTVQRPTRE
jgi:subtilisin